MNMHFDRSAFPQARGFYEGELGELRRPDRKGWARPKSGCPFHHSKSGLSFSVNVDTGGFYCFGCGAKGGDILAFVMRRDGLTFKRAAQALGAWREQVSAQDRRELERAKAERERKAAEESARHEAERRERIDTRDELHALERQYLGASSRLSKLRRGEVERYRGELGLAWWCMADTLPRIRQAETDYFRLAGLEGHVV